MNDDGFLQRAAAEFGELGVTCLRGVFTDWVEPLREGVERNLREPGRYFREYTPEGISGRFVGDYCNWPPTVLTHAPRI